MSSRDTYDLTRPYPKMLSHKMEHLFSFSLWPTRKIHHHQQYSVTTFVRTTEPSNIRVSNRVRHLCDKHTQSPAADRNHIHHSSVVKSNRPVDRPLHQLLFIAQNRLSDWYSITNSYSPTPSNHEQIMLLFYVLSLDFKDNTSRFV